MLDNPPQNAGSQPAEVTRSTRESVVLREQADDEMAGKCLIKQLRGSRLRLRASAERFHYQSQRRVIQLEMRSQIDSCRISLAELAPSRLQEFIRNVYIENCEGAAAPSPLAGRPCGGQCQCVADELSAIRLTGYPALNCADRVDLQAHYRVGRKIELPFGIRRQAMHIPARRPARTVSPGVDEFKAARKCLVPGEAGCVRAEQAYPRGIFSIRQNLTPPACNRASSGAQFFPDGSNFRRDPWKREAVVFDPGITWVACK